MKNDFQNHDDTKLLLDDSFNKNSNIYTLSAIQRKFNNTQQLLDDKTSFLIDSSQFPPQTIHKQFNVQEQREQSSYIFREKDSMRHNFNSSSQNHSFNDDLFSLSNTTKTVNEIKKYQINPEIDYNSNSMTLSYGMVFPTSVSTIQYIIKNISNQATIIEFKISEKTNLKEHFEGYHDICNNSNEKYHCFNILNEQQKIQLQSNEEMTIFIQLQAPYIKTKEKLYCLLEIYNNNFIDKSIPLVAQIEIPKICCLKSIQNATNESMIPVIPIRIELKAKGQRYRLPFKNMSNKDVNIDVLLDISKNKKDSFWFNDEYYKCQILFFPNNLVIPSQGTTNLEMIAKISKGIPNENNNSQQNNQKSVRKIITVKIKDTKLTYSFFLEGFLIE